MRDDLIWVALSEDGVPESKMSSKSINVLTIRLINCSLVVPLAIVKASKKAEVDVNVVWKPLIQEINKMKNLRVHHVAFDAVQRKHVLGMIGHAGYYSCPHCDIRGEYHEKKKKVVYPYKQALKANLRTDSSIRTTMTKLDVITEAEERKGIVAQSPLLDLNHFSFTDNLATDYLHFLCLGKFITNAQI